VLGSAIAATGSTYGVNGQSASSSGIGVFGSATATSGANSGVWGQTASSTGYGVRGLASTTTGTNMGVFGQSNSAGGRGVYGLANLASGFNYGVFGQTNSSAGTAVYGLASAGTGVNYGVYGRTNSNDGTAVLGLATASGNTIAVMGENTGASGNTFGVYGQTNSPDGTGVFGLGGFGSAGIGVYGEGYWAGWFANQVWVNWNLHVVGYLTKGGGSFKIDHPLDPANKYLYHSFVESPDMKNIYDGVVILDSRGEALVEFPSWFETLNKDFRYQLTCIGGFAPVFVAEKMEGNRFRIAGGTPNLEVSWQVTGIRKDAWAEKNRIPVEEEKTGDERGRYLHPDAFGQPKEQGIGWIHKPKVPTRGSEPLEPPGTNIKN